jgi:two-component system heavy metal sensor histidine kinase CusS
MLESMLFLARADDAEIEISPLLMDARGELEKIAEFYQLLADESGARIKCLGTAQVYADPLLLRRAVTNLLSNALRHSPKGAEIVMEATSYEDGSACISVANPGAGIALEYQQKIFDRFYQIERSRDKSGKGVGLGLAIVRTIMHLHGGAVSVTSVPGVVTTFALRFAQAT